MAVLTTLLRRILPASVLSVAALQARGEDVTLDEYQVKAAYLFNFAKFVEWPPEAFAQGDRINICVLGNASFAALLGDTVAGKQVGTRGFTVQALSAGPQGRSCHILFISNTERKRQTVLLSEIQDPYTLPVGESEDFIPSGGVINLTLKQSRVRIEIRSAAARLKCRISSKLIALADATRK